MLKPVLRPLMVRFHQRWLEGLAGAAGGTASSRRRTRRPARQFPGVGALEELRQRLGEINDLSRAASLLAWDERTMMPAAGAEARAETLATLARIRHEMFIRDEIGRLVDEVRSGPEGDAEPGTSIAADLARVVARDWEKARWVPSELRAELARASSFAESVWVEAKRASDFQMLLPTSSGTSSSPIATSPATRASPVFASV